MASELLVFLVTTAIVSHARGLTIEEVEPSYGPLAGGTVVTITLSHTEELKLDGVLMGSHSCFIDSRVEHVTSSVHHVSVTCTAPNITCTRVTCTTSGVVGVREDTVTNVTLTNVTFTYKQNPNVTGISRSKSFKSGGLPVYLEGHHLTHAHSAVLSTVPLNNDDQPIPADFHHSQDCVILSDTRLECVTPNLGVLWTALGLHALPDHVSPRLNTRLVISLDGYRDVIHGFTITEDPTLDEWHHQGAKSYDPEKEVLHIGGQRLLQGAEAGDYRVEVGVAGCRVSRVVDNNIWCTPPESQPQPNTNISINTPTVVVEVGSLRLSLGELVYGTSEDGAAPQVALGVVGGAGWCCTKC